jgi:hypothetical protein
MTGVVAAGVTSHNRELLAQHVDDLAFALIAPLRAKDHC